MRGPTGRGSGGESDAGCGRAGIVGKYSSPVEGKIGVEKGVGDEDEGGLARACGELGGLARVLLVVRFRIGVE